MTASLRPVCLGVLMASLWSATACKPSGNVQLRSETAKQQQPGPVKQDTLIPILPPAPPVSNPAEQADFGENEFSVKAMEDRCDTPETDSIQNKNP